MSPFDLPGPQFLVFYLILGSLALVGLFAARGFVEPDDATKVNLSDPYLIAYLRGGKAEAIRVATVSLIDRGLLKASGSEVSTRMSNAAEAVRLAFEQQVISYFDKPREASSALSQRRFDSTLLRYRDELVRLGLLPDAALKTTRLILLTPYLAVVWGAAITKYSLAIQRGHRNVQFLIMLALVFGALGWFVALPRQTGKGRALLKDLRSLFQGVKERASSFHPGSNPNELALLAAVFGIAAIPVDVFPYGKALYPKADSSSGGSCGSSCGGGGCGGGCGGCGS